MDFCMSSMPFCGWKHPSTSITNDLINNFSLLWKIHGVSLDRGHGQLQAKMKTGGALWRKRPKKDVAGYGNNWTAYILYSVVEEKLHRD
ncbi:hypothetical protein T4C_8445 [Trichinella pseudospiralis]|uniref:Uncharacterized protein n=1 Tax=Trichinella pseudospiralis TaxID=6337 RepID=A0A0V1INA1_TRIPS|nr:hypothetical protein T4C_8445 [Trichinella pseudospiralis]